MKKLLLAVDGSPNSIRAAQFAAELASALPAVRIVLLNVQSPVMAWEISPHVTAELVTQIHKQAGHGALKAARELLRSKNLDFDERLETGEPGHVIAERAAAEGVDGIVMGTRGMGLIKSLVLGSIANKVIHLAQVPVTLVK